MQHTELSEFAQMMIALSALYDRSMNEALVEIYWQALKGFDLEVIREAFQAHVNNPDTGQFMPKPADVVRYLNGSSKTQSLQAWSRIVQALRSVGTYHSVVFDDPLIHAVIADMGGWARLGKLTEKETNYCAHEFQQRYSGYSLHPPLTYPQYLIGHAEQHNGAKGYSIEPPLMIGDLHKAKYIYEQGTMAVLSVRKLDDVLGNQKPQQLGWQQFQSISVAGGLLENTHSLTVIGKKEPTEVENND